MSRLEELLQTLCPDGVEYKKLGQVCTFIKGKGLSKNAKWLGDIPIILYGELYTTYGNYITEVFSHTSEDLISSSPIIHKGDLLLPVSSTTKEAQIGKASVYMVDKPAYLGGDAILLRHKQNPSFLMYLLNGNLFEKSKMKCVFGTTINHLHPSKLSNIYIPVPPLLVQEEIVRILDTFTALENELEAELAARTKQYEHYRNESFDFDDDNSVSCVPLESVIISLKTGLNPRKNFELNTEDAENYYVTVRELAGKDIRIFDKTDKVNDEALRLINNRSNLEVNDILFSGTGTVGRTAIVQQPPSNWNIKEGVYVIKPDTNKINPIYLLYLLQSDVIKKKYEGKIVGSPVISLPMYELRKLLIPIPSLEVQEQIVSYLDRFDTLVNDLKSGLPAEIALRRKQYEYYRDKLLTFQPLE